MQRSQYFGDQNVVAEDYNYTESSRIDAIRSLIVAICPLSGSYTKGVAGTYLLSPGALYADSGSSTSVITVYPGTAFDNSGDRIFVPTDTGSYSPPKPPREDLSWSGDGGMYVKIAYAEMSGSLKYDDLGASYPTRYYDSYEITIDTSAPTANEILLTTFTSTGGAISGDVTDQRRWLGSLVAQATYVSVDGTTPMEANWNIGAFDLTAQSFKLQSGAFVSDTGSATPPTGPLIVNSKNIYFGSDQLDSFEDNPDFRQYFYSQNDSAVHYTSFGYNWGSDVYEILVNGSSLDGLHVIAPSHYFFSNAAGAVGSMKFSAKGDYSWQDHDAAHANRMTLESATGNLWVGGSIEVPYLGVSETGSFGSSGQGSLLNIHVTDNDGTGLQVISHSSGTDGAHITLYQNSATPAALDDIGFLTFDGKNSTGDRVTFGEMKTKASTVTSGSEYAWMVWTLRTSWGMNEAMRLLGDGSLYLDSTAPSGSHALPYLFDDEDDSTLLEDLVKGRNQDYLASLGLTHEFGPGQVSWAVQPVVRLLAGASYQQRDQMSAYDTRLTRIEECLQIS